MNLVKLSARIIATTAMALASLASFATPVTLTLDGSITAYPIGNLDNTGLNIGSPVHLTMSFNETWSDGTYLFTDPLGPASGSMTVGGFAFVFNDAKPNAYGGDADNVQYVRPIFTGTGPTLAGQEFYALFFSLTPAMQLTGDMLLGYSLALPSAVVYSYATITPTSYTVTRDAVNAVPTPATLPLVGLALLALGWTRRRRT